MSTHYSPKYSRTAFKARYPLIIGKGKSISVLYEFDRLDPRYLSIVNESVPTKVYTVGVGDTLPNISYLFYQTTSLWWVIARKNGIVVPTSIQPGDTLLIPALNTISVNVSSSDTSNLGSTTTI